MTRIAAAEVCAEGGVSNVRCWVDSEFMASAFCVHRSTTIRSTTISTTKREYRRQTSFNKTDSVLKSFNVHRTAIVSGNCCLRVQGLSLIVARAVKKNPVFYGSRKSSSLFIKAHRSTQSWQCSNQDHIFTRLFTLLMIHWNIITRCTVKPKWSLPFRFSNDNFVRRSHSTLLRI
jgi:hypothetical protein